MGAGHAREHGPLSTPPPFPLSQLDPPSSPAIDMKTSIFTGRVLVLDQSLDQPVCLLWIIIAGALALSSHHRLKRRVPPNILPARKGLILSLSTSTSMSVKVLVSNRNLTITLNLKAHSQSQSSLSISKLTLNLTITLNLKAHSQTQSSLSNSNSHRRRPSRGCRCERTRPAPPGPPECSSRCLPAPRTGRCCHRASSDMG